MQRSHFPLELVKLPSRRLHQQKHFCASLDLSLPAINRFNLGQDLNAGRKVSANQHFREPRRFLTVRGRHKNYNCIVVHRKLLFIVFQLALGWSTSKWRRVGAEERLVNFSCAIHVTLVDENQGAFPGR